MRERFTKHSLLRPTPLRRWPGAGSTVASLLLVWILASVFVHPLPHQASDRAGAPLLLGADIPPSVADVFAHACINCHSERTRWPWYSNAAPVSWLIQNDVKRARARLNLSRWDRLDS